jgi:chromosome segregation protein
MLSDMEKNLEGYNRSVKVILQECKLSPEFGKGIHGALAQLISVEGKFETAIEMTLGSALQNIVTSREEDAKKAIEYLRQNKLGRATFLPVNSVNGKGYENSLSQDIRKQEGFCGIASELVKFDTEYRGIISSLLGKVAVVDNLDSGIKMARKFGYSFRIVTLEGDILSTSGSMSGGSNDNRGHGILSRSREISELSEEISSLKKEEILLEKQLKEIIELINEISAEQAQEEAKVRENELVKIRDESHLNQITENLRKAAAKIDMLKQEKQQLARREAEVANELMKYEAEQ